MTIENVKKYLFFKIIFIYVKKLLLMAICDYYKIHIIFMYLTFFNINEVDQISLLLHYCVPS